MAIKIEKKDINPRCPHCEKVVEYLVEVKRGALTVVQVYCCPHCEKIVGTSRNS